MNDKIRKVIFNIFMVIAIIYGLYLNVYYYIERTKSEPKELYYEYLCFNDVSSGIAVDFKYGLQRTYTFLEKKIMVELPISKIVKYYQSEAKKNGWLKEDITEISNEKVEMSYKKGTLSLFIRIIELDKNKCTVTVSMSAPKPKKEKLRQRRAYLER